MKRIQAFVVLALIIIIAFSCSRSGVKDSFDPTELFKDSIELYEKEKYYKAQINFQKLIYSFPGQNYIDTAQFYLGMSHFHMSNYSEAIGEFRRLLTAYPASDFADDSHYHIGAAYFERSPGYAKDQTDTYDCIDELSDFLNGYPDSPLAPDAREKLAELDNKLAKKAYKNGELYFNIGDYEPSLLYFQQVRDNYPNTEWAQLAFYYSSEAFMKNDEYAKALESFQNFIITFPDHKLVKKARKNITKLQKEENGG